jgi:hypothetical protein
MAIPCMVFKGGAMQLGRLGVPSRIHDSPMHADAQMKTA